MIDAVYVLEVRVWIYLEVDERLSSSILTKMISEPQTGIKPATFWGSEIAFLSIELDDCSSTSRYIQVLTSKT